MVYLEPRERVWWLQLSFCPARRANSAPPNPLAGFVGPLRSERKRGEREVRGKWKKGKGRKKTTFRIKFLVTVLLPAIDCCYLATPLHSAIDCCYLATPLHSIIVFFRIFYARCFLFCFLFCFISRYSHFVPKSCDTLSCLIVSTKLTLLRLISAHWPSTYHHKLYSYICCVCRAQSWAVCTRILDRPME